MFTNSILDRAEWDRANLTKANLAGASITGLKLSVLANYTGMIVSESETKAIVEELGVLVLRGRDAWPRAVISNVATQSSIRPSPEARLRVRFGEHAW